MLPGQSNALSHCADNQTPQDVEQDKLSQAKSGRRELRTMMTEPLTVVGPLKTDNSLQRDTQKASKEHAERQTSGKGVWSEPQTPHRPSPTKENEELDGNAESVYTCFSLQLLRIHLLMFLNPTVFIWMDMIRKIPCSEDSDRLCPSMSTHIRH